MVIGFMDDESAAYYDGAICKLTSVSFTPSKDLTSMTCTDLFFNKATFVMTNDATNNVQVNLTGSSTSYSTSNGVTYINLNIQMYRLFEVDNST